MIEKKYIRLRKGVVAEYRRIVTPFFYINLKPKEYKHYDYRSPFLSMGYFGMVPLPKGMTVRNKGWESQKGKVFDEKLEKKLDIENEKQKDNLINLFA